MPGPGLFSCAAFSPRGTGRPRGRRFVTGSRRPFPEPSPWRSPRSIPRERTSGTRRERRAVHRMPRQAHRRARADPRPRPHRVRLPTPPAGTGLRAAGASWPDGSRSRTSAGLSGAGGLKIRSNLITKIGPLRGLGGRSRPAGTRVSGMRNRPPAGGVLIPKTLRKRWIVALSTSTGCPRNVSRGSGRKMGLLDPWRRRHVRAVRR